MIIKWVKWIPFLVNPLLFPPIQVDNLNISKHEEGYEMKKKKCMRILYNTSLLTES
jgi:hypothetical protein